MVAKSSSTRYYPFFRVGIVNWWHDTVHARAQRHKNRGVSKRPQVASISANLVSTNELVRRLRVGGKPMDKAAVTRIITKAATLLNARSTIRQHNMSRSADHVEDKVNEHVTAKSKSWWMDLAAASKLLDLVTDTQPLFGSMQRVSSPFGGSLLDDGPYSSPGNGAGRSSAGTVRSSSGGGGAGGDARGEWGSGDNDCGDRIHATGLADCLPGEKEANRAFVPSGLATRPIARGATPRKVRRMGLSRRRPSPAKAARQELLAPPLLPREAPVSAHLAPARGLGVPQFGTPLSRRLCRGVRT